MLHRTFFHHFIDRGHFSDLSVCALSRRSVVASSIDQRVRSCRSMKMELISYNMYDILWLVNNFYVGDVSLNLGTIAHSRVTCNQQRVFILGTVPYPQSAVLCLVCCSVYQSRIVGENKDIQQAQARSRCSIRRASCLCCLYTVARSCLCPSSSAPRSSLVDPPTTDLDKDIA